MICEFCKKKHDKKRRKYCSKKCAKAGFKSNMIKQKKIKICLMCDKQFALANWKNNKFCSSECAKKQPNISKFNIYRKGKSYQELYSDKSLKEIKEINEKKVESAKKTISNYTDEKKEKIHIIRSDAAKKSGNGGYRENSGRGKKSWYESKITGRVFLHSSYELAYAKWLDENEINWERNKKWFNYEFEGKVKKYYPDFFLIDENCYVEIKGFETEKDILKWQFFPCNLKILKKDDLLKLNIKI